MKAIEPALFLAPSPPLQVKDVHFSHPGHPVFRGLCLDVRPGEFLVLIGPSGCGKSTLLNLLAGFESAQQGQVLLNGEPARPESRELAYVFQSPQLFPWLNALENVRFGLRMNNAVQPETQIAQALDALARVGLEQHAQKLPRELSGGMQQRVAIARALCLKPNVLLMDEPFSALDAMTRQAMNEELLRLKESIGQTIVFITHDIDEAIFLADRIIVLGKAPQGIQQEVTIHLPGPRTLQGTRKLPRFLEYRQALIDQISAADHAA